MNQVTELLALLPLEEEAPEGVFVIVVKVLEQDLGIQLAVYAIVPLVELIVAGGLKRGLVPAHEFQHFLRILALLHIEGGHRRREGLYLLAEGLPELVIQLPVGTGAHVNILPARVVIVPGEFL